MAGYTAIEDAGRALVGLLEAGLQTISATGESVSVQLISPGDVEGADVHLSLYLYRVTENDHLKNVEPRAADGIVGASPLTLDLYYLLTAHPANTEPETADTYDQHRILGQAMRVLHNNRVLRGAGDEPDLHLSIYPQSTDELTGVWSTFADMPYQPSVAYLLTPVVIDSERETPTGRVEARRVDTYAPGPGRGDTEERGGSP